MPRTATEIPTIRAECGVGLHSYGTVEISGWYDGPRGTYLWFGVGGRCVGTLKGKRLLDLAQKIVAEHRAPVRKKKRRGR